MVSRDGGYRHPDHDLHYSRSRAERGGRSFWSAGAGIRRFLRYRRLHFALLNHYYGLGFWTCLPIAGLMAAAAGFLLGFPVLRLRGDYLAIVTLGFGEIVRILLLNNTEITGGPNGISQIPKPTFFGLEFSRTAREGGWDTFSNFFGLKYDPSDRVIFLYLVALLLVVLSLFVINRLLRMPLGRAWEALREDEIACRSLGLSPRRIKLTAFTISAAFAGFAGTLFAARQALSARNPSPLPNRRLCWR